MKKSVKKIRMPAKLYFWGNVLAALGIMFASCDLGGDGIGNSRNENGNGNNTTGLAAPSGVTASAVSSTEIFISWYSVSGASGYNVYWAENAGGPYDFDGSTSANITSFISSDWLPGGTGYFRVTAVNNAGESAMSPYVYATTPSVSPGSSPSTAIELTSSITAWTGGVLSSGSPGVWYSINIGSTTGWYLAGKDKYAGGSFYTGDVSFEIYNSSLLFYTTIDAGAGGAAYLDLSGTAGVDYISTWPNTGTWYIKVVPYGGYTANYGTYAIYFY
jgi:hypothetical protein